MRENILYIVVVRNLWDITINTIETKILLQFLVLVLMQDM